jgi:hypothetical protein
MKAEREKQYFQMETAKQVEIPNQNNADRLKFK